MERKNMVFETRYELIVQIIMSLSPIWSYDTAIMVITYMKNNNIYFMSPNNRFYRTIGDCCDGYDNVEQLVSLPKHSNVDGYTVKGEMRSMYRSSNGDIHLMGGNGLYYCFDSTCQKWTQNNTLPTLPNHSSPLMHRWSAVSVVIGHKTYLLGGKTAHDDYRYPVHTNAIDVFDNTTQTWSLGSYVMNITSSSKHAAVAIGNIIYIFNCQVKGQIIDTSYPSSYPSSSPPLDHDSKACVSLSSLTQKHHYTPKLLFSDVTYPVAVVISSNQVLIFDSGKKDVMDYNPITNILVISKTIRWNPQRRQYTIYKIWFDSFTNSLFVFASSSSRDYSCIYSCVLPSTNSTQDEVTWFRQTHISNLGAYY
jgi:hypothetical protein